VSKTRVDALMVARGFTDNETRAQALIIAGKVYTGERRLEKPGQKISDDAPLEVRGPDYPWVSRGGVKLAHALERFDIDPSGQAALDIGAATGGFTDVLLSQGATRVYAIDVGHGQLDWRLRNDPRVVVLERTNARHLNADLVSEAIYMVVCDASFIGLRTILPASLKIAAPGALLVALIKPQFEVRKEQVGKHGVIRDPALREEACERIRSWLDSLLDWSVLGIIESPITGPRGNVEYLIAARKTRSDAGV
jgi:23S rRNA (cytidine1920-2'-O)/16S rRNA (cytidine1409-2'-O)-methyltransferase